MWPLSLGNAFNIPCVNQYGNEGKSDLSKLLKVSKFMYMNSIGLMYQGKLILIYPHEFFEI